MSSEQDAVERLIGRINVLRDKAVDLTDRYAGDRYRETHGEDTPATFPEDYLYDALIEARVVLADAKKALEAQRKENEWLTKAVEYYKTGLSQTSRSVPRPKYVPKTIRVDRTVRSEGPGRRLALKPGEYHAVVNPNGAVSVRMGKGSFLGVKPGEFEVVEWQENPALEEGTQ